MDNGFMFFERCQKCGNKMYCPCPACKSSLPDGVKPWVWDETGELISCSSCGYQAHADEWLDHFGKSYEESKTGNMPITGKPMVSVIIPTYNRPNYLHRALKSVAGQSWTFIEAVVVNDGGEDVIDIVEEMRSFIDINYVNLKKNVDRAAARNEGLRVAKGDYIAYLDDDDIFYYDHIETCLRILTNSKFKIVYTTAKRAHQKLIGGDYITEKTDIPYNINYRDGLFLKTNITPTPCVMHSAEIIKTVGMFDTSLPVLEDWDYWVRISQKYEFFHIDKVTCEFSWRQDGTSTTSSKLDEFAPIRKKIRMKYNKKKVSIIMLTWNALEYTKMCITSIDKFTTYPYEIVFVDNGSTDGTVDYIKGLVNKRPDLYKARYNKKNAGFGGGNNQGVKLATGEYILFLNNDVVVSSEWLTNMVETIELSDKVGAVGPLTNRISGRQNVVVDYDVKDLQSFFEQANSLSARNKGNVKPRRRIAGFAMLMRKSLFNELGGFDNRFSIGNFEDDDLCLRIRDTGRAVLVNQGVFIHHFANRTFSANKLDYDKIMRQNHEVFFNKWPDIEYSWLIEENEMLTNINDGMVKTAYSLANDGRFEESIRIFETVLGTDPLNRQALEGAAHCHYNIGNYDKYIEYLHQWKKPWWDIRIYGNMQVAV